MFISEKYSPNWNPSRCYNNKNKQTTRSPVFLVYARLSWYNKLAFMEVSKYTQSIQIMLHTEKNRNKPYLIRYSIASSSAAFMQCPALVLSDQNGLVRRSRTAVFIHIFLSQYLLWYRPCIWALKQEFYCQRTLIRIW